jgi:hypothetical protein
MGAIRSGDEATKAIAADFAQEPGLQDSWELGNKIGKR